MNNGYMDKIKKRIDKSSGGTIFVYSDFMDIADSATIRKSIQRLITIGKLNRIIDGIFQKPQYNELLKQNIPASPESVANAIARNYHWDIAPCDDVALNLMGLSTQVPSNWTYVSSGPYKKYKWDNIELIFKHRTNRELTNMSQISLLTVQVLKALGKNRIDEKTISAIRSQIDDKDKKRLLKETKNTSEWIYSNIKKICEV